jgi:hypothetical protein
LTNKKYKCIIKKIKKEVEKMNIEKIKELTELYNTNQKAFYEYFKTQKRKKENKKEYKKDIEKINIFSPENLGI